MEYITILHVNIFIKSTALSDPLVRFETCAVAITQTQPRNCQKICASDVELKHIASRGSFLILLRWSGFGDRAHQRPHAWANATHSEMTKC